jgi:flavin reductase (DIM6/NTAB) family NADH-FMN oxidoreductase RutF
MAQNRPIDPKNHSQRELHRLLLSAIGPRPIAFASTIDQEDNVNLSPFSFFNVFSSNPPILIFSPSRRGSDNSTKHTLDNVHAVKEVVINCVTYEMVEQMLLSSSDFKAEVNEFDKSGFTPISSSKVQPPRVKESPAAFECTVENIIPLGMEGGSGNLVICRVVFIHVNEELLDNNFTLDQKKIDLVGRMGGNYYIRAHEKALFEVKKTGSEIPIGVNALPHHVINSKILSGNDLGKLGSIKKLPNIDEIAQTLEIPEIIKLIKTNSQDRTQLIESFHTFAKSKIMSGNEELSLRILLAFDYYENS